MRSLALLLLVATIMSACGASTSLPQSRYVRSNRNLERTVSVVQNFPADNSIDVPLDTEISLRYSGRISYNSIDFFKFRVEDEFGIQVPGEIRTSSDQTTLKFVPTQMSRQVGLNPNTTYTVRSRFVEDQSGYVVGSYNWQFRTKKAAASTGRFKVVNVLPDDTLLFPGQRISVKFNEVVKPPEVDERLPNEPECSASLWNDAFQVLVVVPLDGDGNTEVRTLQPRKICRKLEASGGGQALDTLVFYPLNSESVLPGASYVDIVIRPTEGLRGNTSGEMLLESTTARKFVLPDPRTILELLF